VQSSRQQRERQRQKEGVAAKKQQQQRGWAAQAFGVKPQDIYMELVNAVLQVGLGAVAVCTEAGTRNDECASAGCIMA
jgi:hypothetical protein